MGKSTAALRFSALFVTIGIIASGCRQEVQQQAPPPPVVTVAPVETQPIVEWSEFTGRTEAVEHVEIRPRVSGHIEEVKFQSGQLVKKGDVLFTIDARWHQAEFSRREAEHAQAKVRLANAEREAKRSAQLLASRAISTEEAEQREARFQEAKAALLAAEAARDTAQLDLEYTQVRSPINGRVSRALITQGNYVSGMAGNATLLTTVVSVAPIYVYADVDENSLLKFNSLVASKKLVGDENGRIPVHLQLADEQGFPRRGYIESFDNRIDPSTGSILLRAIFENEDGRMTPGLFARIRVPASERRLTMLVDEKAIGTDQAQKFVLALTASNTVEYRKVELGPEVNGKRIVRSGLKPTDQIVVNGTQRVRPGMPVTAQPAEAEASGGPQTAQR